MKITIDKSSARQRFDRFLRKYFKAYPEITLSDIFSRIRKGAIKVNNRKTKENYRLQLGDCVEWDDSITTQKDATKAMRSKKQKIRHYPLADIQAMLIHEDAHRLVFNKPADIAMHPGSKHIKDLSLHDIMKSYFLQTKQNLVTETFHPSFCFRLDKDTSGVVIAAKTFPALQYLNKVIREREIEKTYIAVVQGKYTQKQTIEAPLFKGYDKKSGRGKMFINSTKGVDAKTEALPLSSLEHPILGDISLVEVYLHTGRMHQIRIHMAHIGHPLIGDIMYGDPALNRIATKRVHIARQLLHSYRYGFFDVFSDTTTTYTAPIPNIIQQLFTTYSF